MYSMHHLKACLPSISLGGKRDISNGTGTSPARGGGDEGDRRRFGGGKREDEGVYGEILEVSILIPNED
jgi:hypothetical protein